MDVQAVERLMRETKTDGYPEDLVEFAAAVVAAERERCLYWCSLGDHEGYATHHIRAGSPSASIIPIYPD